MLKHTGFRLGLLGLFLCAASVIPALAADGIPVGILHSLTGTMAFSEKPVVEATLLAIEEINQAGGVLGEPIIPVVRDGASNWDVFASEATDLITKDHVAVVFGCWTSASRKTVKPVFEHYNHLLFYPVQYEGLEQSPNIVYTGAAPNQQIIPAVKWSLDNLGRRFYLVGSDYVFPRAANAIIRDQVTSLRGEILGEQYIPLGSRDVKAVIDEIVKRQPDVILNTINGDTNIEFFKALRAAGITPEKIPTVSFSIAEPELQAMGLSELEGDYAVWNYFQSVEHPANHRFIEHFKAKYGRTRVVSDPMEAAYVGVYLWAQAVRQAKSTDVAVVRKAISGQVMDAPEGLIFIDPATHHTWKQVRVGRIRNDLQFDIVWETSRPFRPIPYPLYRSKGAWQLFLDRLYFGWGNHWAKPAESGP